MTKMTKKINIDILMPVYNEALYIKQAVLSVLEHSYDEDVYINLIVVDDHSTDQTFEIINKIESVNKSCKLTLISGGAKGKNNAINSAYENSTGDFLCLMGGDDIIEPDVLIERARVLDNFLNRAENQDRCAISFCKLKMFSDNPKFNNIIIPKSPLLGSTSGGGLMMTRAYAERIFPLPVSLPNEDTWIGLYIKYFPCKQIHVPRVGLNYRIHEHNSHKRNGNFVEYKEMIWRRSRALFIFYSKYYSEMQENIEKKLLMEMAFSISQYLGWWFIVLFVRGVSVRERFKMYTHMTKVGFSIRHLFFRFFAGH